MNSTTCSLTMPNDLANGDYDIWTQSYGPGGLNDWAQAGSFAVEVPTSSSITSTVEPIVIPTAEPTEAVPTPEATVAPTETVIPTAQPEPTETVETPEAEITEEAAP